ncbi:MAG: hypothetical protein ACKOW2_09435 [Sphingobacteriaceae bacterium]
MATKQPTPVTKKDNNKLYLLLFLLLALFTTNAVLFFRNRNAEAQVTKLGDEKSLMQTEIDKIEAALDKANNDYALLNEDMHQQQAEARKKIAELREALRNGELTQKQLILAREDVKQLRYFVGKYVKDIEELKKENASLTTERDSLKTKVSSVSERAQALEKQNKDLDKKVRAAAALKVSAIKINPVRVKDNGKETSVSKASGAQKLNINFQLANNDMADKGFHNIYLRVIDPNGNLIIADTGSMFLANGDEMQFSYKTAVEFANDGKLYTISWTNPEPFQKGVYTIMLYADGFTIGSANLNLK